MATTQVHPPETRRTPRQSRRRGAFLAAAIVLAVIAAVIVGIILFVGGNDEEPAASPTTAPTATSTPTTVPVVITPGTPEAVMAQLVAAVQSSDAAIPDLSAPLDAPGTSFLEWNLALGMDPAFGDCAVTSGSAVSQATCDVTMGEDYFFSRVAGTNLATTVNVSFSTETGALTVQSWPPPPGLVEVENDLREWVRVNHPEAEDRMFGADFAGVVKFSKEAGELHTGYLDEYLAYRATPLTPDEVMNRLATTVQAIDAERFTGLTAPLDETGTNFLEWNSALGLDPAFTDCAEQSSVGDYVTIRCAVTMGDGYFFSVIAGENAATSVTFTVDTGEGTLGIGSWPPPRGLVEAERAFQEWIVANHPDDEDRMFGNDYADVLRFSQEAGELHMQHLNEYLTYLAANG